jgi:hypothetical protein
MGLESLTTLDIGNCGLGMEAVRKLVRAHWPELILFNLSTLSPT